MSIAGTVTLAGNLLTRHLLSRSCTRQAAAQGWASAGTFACFYEETPPATGAPLDYEGGTGYAYRVYAPAGQAMAVTDRVIVDGMTLEVVRLVAAGSADPLIRFDCVRR
jgi:hypothetical protein